MGNAARTGRSRVGTIHTDEHPERPHPGNANAPSRCLNAYLSTYSYFLSVHKFINHFFYRYRSLG